jgi:hypothetical protein
MCALVCGWSQRNNGNNSDLSLGSQQLQHFMRPVSCSIWVSALRMVSLTCWADRSLSSYVAGSLDLLRARSEASDAMDEIVALVTVFPTACQDRRLVELLAWFVIGNCVAPASCGSVAVPCAHMQLRFGAMMPGCSTESVPGLLSQI